ncbi:MAG: aminomethyltransferase family protein [Lachnospiraceae bacterium]|jgi:aminomethyltransferase|nr:aminomethyltransferase family protein [Lachnospiraceae bacterium]
MFSNIYKNSAFKRAEHEAVRQTVGWYYFTHFLVEVKGADAAKFLDWVCACPILSLAEGRARYTTILRDNALILDDVVVFHIEGDTFWLSSLFIKKILPWLTGHKEGYDVEITDITAAWDMYAVQGPLSKDLIGAIAKESVEGQKFFAIAHNEIAGVPVKVARGGFTGEAFGYEVYVPAAETKAIRGAISAEAGKLGGLQVTEFQVMVWTLPTEKGFIHMIDVEGLNPIEAGLDKGIAWDRDFIGKEALEKTRAEGAKRKLLGFVADNPDAHIPSRMLGAAGTPVIFGGEEVGRVTKYTYGFTAGKNIGYAIVDAGKVKPGDVVSLNDNTATLTVRVFV